MIVVLCDDSDVIYILDEYRTFPLTVITSVSVVPTVMRLIVNVSCSELLEQPVYELTLREITSSAFRHIFGH